MLVHFSAKNLLKILPTVDSKMHHTFDRFFHRLFFDFGSILEANLDPCWPPWGHLGGSWRPLGGLLGHLGSLLGPLGGQDPPETRGLTFLEASWGRLGLILRRFLDRCWINVQHFSYLISKDVNIS